MTWTDPLMSLALLLGPPVAAGVLIAVIEFFKRRDFKKRAEIHRLSFLPAQVILCQNNAAEAGSSKTVGSMARQRPV